jgi:hypothetical protein
MASVYLTKYNEQIVFITMQFKAFLCRIPNGFGYGSSFPHA